MLPEEKDHKHVRKVGTLQNVLLAFIKELWKTWKIKLLKKWTKIAQDIISLHTCVPKTTIIWGTVPGTQSEIEFFCHFGPFFDPLPPNNPENQNFEKMKKASGYVIILNLCNKKHNHMMHAYSDMECDRHNFLSFQAIFCSFAPLLNPKIKIWKKCKKTPGDIILLHMCTINQDHMMHGSWDMKCNRQNFFVILGNFLPFYCSRDMTLDWCNCYFHFWLYFSLLTP